MIKIKDLIPGGYLKRSDPPEALVYNNSGNEWLSVYVGHGLLLQRDQVIGHPEELLEARKGPGSIVSDSKHIQNGGREYQLVFNGHIRVAKLQHRSEIGQALTQIRSVVRQNCGTVIQGIAGKHGMSVTEVVVYFDDDVIVSRRLALSELVLGAAV